MDEIDNKNIENPDRRDFLKSACRFAMFALTTFADIANCAAGITASR